MKITINRKSFIDALSIGGSMSGKNKTLPILDMAKVTIKGKSATISSFDSEVAITLRSQIINSEEDVVFCVNPKDLLAILKTLKDEDVVLNIENNTCVVEHSKGKMELTISDSEDFPTPNKDSESVGVVVDSETLVGWVRKAKNFIEQNDIRPIMGGMYLYYNANELGCAATNAHKLFWDYIEVASGVIEGCDAVLTSKAMDALVAMVAGSENVDVIFSKNNISFKTANAMLLCRKIDGKFPAFKSIIPKESAINVNVSIDELKDAINRANLMAGMTHLLKFDVRGFNMHIESCDFDFGKKSNEDVACSVEGEGITIGFNGMFLMDCLNALDASEVVINMSEPSRPIVFKEGKKTILLMPMRIS